MNTEKIRQSDVMAENGISAALICRVRDKYVTDAEWWKEGTLIYWTTEAAARVKAALNPNPQTDEQDKEGQPGIQVQPETPMPPPEVPAVSPSQPDAGDSGSDTEAAGATEAQAEAPLIARVLKRARNYRFVYASLDGERIAVLCPKKGQRNIVGKNVRVEKSTIEGETRYTLIP